MTEQIDIVALEDFLERNLPTYLGLLQQMVDVNSFTANWEGVNALGDLTAEIFGRLGFTAERVPSVSPQYGDHLILMRPGRLPARIGLISHLDTVFPKEEETRQRFAWRPEGDRIYGPGTVDIKGGTILIYMMLDALRALAPALFAELTWLVLLDACEETLGDDFGALCVERLSETGLAALVFEGGLLLPEEHLANLVVARKGMAVYRVVVDGRASHAGSAHGQGANAVVQMADVIRRVADLTDYDRDITFNVGTVAGGTVVNRVPHQAVATVEMRAFDPDVFAAGLAQMEALNALSTVASEDGYACNVTVSLERQTMAWPENEGTAALFRLWQEAAATIGYKALPEHRGGLSDGNQLWQAVPTLDGLGPSGGNAHCSERSADGSKDQEYVRVASFVPKAMINVLGLIRLAAAHAEGKA
jgi:glutamate carboxypeptidase